MNSLFQSYSSPHLTSSNITTTPSKKKRFSLFSGGKGEKNAIITPVVESSPKQHQAQHFNNNNNNNNNFASGQSSSSNGYGSNIKINNNANATGQHGPETEPKPSLDSKLESKMAKGVDFDKDKYLQLGLEYHEKEQFEKATYYWKLSSKNGSTLGSIFYGLALRHGWGCKENPSEALMQLQKAAESAVFDLQTGTVQSTSATKVALAMAIHEIGVCFQFGLGIPKNKKTAAQYFHIASNLGDAEAQNDLGLCYEKGIGVKKDPYNSAKYYRLAEKQGHRQPGNSWIWKPKYDKVEEGKN